GIELIGAPPEVIRRAEDRELFRETVREAGLKVPESLVVTSLADLPADLSFPVILRPAFTLGGHGGGIASSRRELEVMLERAVGVECGGSNIQFARDRATGDVRVIEMNPRVSRSSALASKATGYPIAKVAAKLAVGYTLDEIPNDLTGTTPASFEPTLDYVVVKFPRFAFEKFPGADATLGTQMKSVGEAMGIGRTFGEAFLKARRSRELDERDAWELPEGAHPWFRAELERLDAGVDHVDDLVADDWVRLKRLGLSDGAIAE